VDATRVISRVEYDCESNRMVGFILPCGDAGLPLTDSFLETTFEAIEALKVNRCLSWPTACVCGTMCPGIPPICLGCVGINNVFTATDVLK